jgi:hypothetical protein
MAHGVTPKNGGKLLDGKEDKEEVFEDAMMEVPIDESATAATAGEEEKTTPADAEVPGSKAEEANTEEGWRRVGGRAKRDPIPPLPPVEKPLVYKEVHLQILGPLANRAAVVRKLGGPANVK